MKRGQAEAERVAREMRECVDRFRNEHKLEIVCTQPKTKEEQEVFDTQLGSLQEMTERPSEAQQTLVCMLCYCLLMHIGNTIAQKAQHKSTKYFKQFSLWMQNDFYWYEQLVRSEVGYKVTDAGALGLLEQLKQITTTYKYI